MERKRVITGKRSEIRGLSLGKEVVRGRMWIKRSKGCKENNDVVAVGEKYG